MPSGRTLQTPTTPAAFSFRPAPQVQMTSYKGVCFVLLALAYDSWKISNGRQTQGCGVDAHDAATLPN